MLKKRKYYLFIDESGDHGLTRLDPSFPVFLLCGIICSETNYIQFRDEINDIKKSLWGKIEVIFHSRDIRKHEKEFQIFFDKEKKHFFYATLNRMIVTNTYRIIASAIDKEKYIKRYGHLTNDVYEVALSSIIERAVFCLDEIDLDSKQLEIIIEKRGKKEDKQLSNHFLLLISRGTSFVSAQQLKELNVKIHFRNKKENINGLQMADLFAYPIAKYVMDPKKANPAYDILSSKIYMKKGKQYGLKIFL